MSRTRLRFVWAALVFTVLCVLGFRFVTAILTSDISSNLPTLSVLKSIGQDVGNSLEDGLATDPMVDYSWPFEAGMRRFPVKWTPERGFTMSVFPSSLTDSLFTNLRRLSSEGSDALGARKVVTFEVQNETWILAGIERVKDGGYEFVGYVTNNRDFVQGYSKIWFERNFRGSELSKRLDSRWLRKVRIAIHDSALDTTTILREGYTSDKNAQSDPSAKVSGISIPLGNLPGTVIALTVPDLFDKPIRTWTNGFTFVAVGCLLIIGLLTYRRKDSTV